MTDTNFYSEELLDFMVDEYQQVISLSIHHNNVLQDKYINTSYGTTLSNNIKKELTNFTYLVGNELTAETLYRLKDQIILYQYPNTHTFADTYQLGFMRVNDVIADTNKINIQKLKYDDVFLRDPENPETIIRRQFVDKYEENILYLQQLDEKFRIWIPYEMYLDMKRPEITPEL